ncbi:DUF3089 domain-containing protein [soil metagenome]
MTRTPARRTLVIRALGVALAVGLSATAGCSVGQILRRPAEPFDAARTPPAPDYSLPETWQAFPGRDGLERSTPPGLSAVNEAEAPADVFFIHPTTYLDNSVWNGPWDAPDDVARLNPAVLLNQVSAFNGCCRLYAPHYRQATLAGLGNPQAVALAYSDIAAAFRYFIARHNDGRPFIIASHSQGTAHAIRLLQEEILGTPLQDRLVAAWLVGGYVPDNFGELGLPVCDAPDQTGCVLSWNTSQTGRRGANILIDNKTYWWRGAEKSSDQAPAICVNPLTWRRQGAADAQANPGSLALSRGPYPTVASPLPALTPHLTGAECDDRLLAIDIPGDAAGFHDGVSALTGSYHGSDYGIFYAAIRANAVERVAAWKASHPTLP